MRGKDRLRIPVTRFGWFCLEVVRVIASKVLSLTTNSAEQTARWRQGSADVLTLLEHELCLYAPLTEAGNPTWYEGT
jgi:hypothetical protein